MVSWIRFGGVKFVSGIGVADWGGDRLREDPRTRAIPVIVLSADAIPARVRRMLDAGARAYLTKPLDVHNLLAAVDAALGRE